MNIDKSEYRRAGWPDTCGVFLGLRLVAASGRPAEESNERSCVWTG